MSFSCCVFYISLQVTLIQEYPKKVRKNPCFISMAFKKGKSVYIFINFINFTEGDEQPQFTFPPDEFTSKKITTKILQQIEVINSDSRTLQSVTVGLSNTVSSSFSTFHHLYGLSNSVI